MTRIFDGFLSSTESPQAFSESHFVAAMLRFESALARAQASLGLIPETAAQSIIGTCKVELFDVPKIVRESARAGSPAVPLVKSLRETVGLFNRDAGNFVHFGSTNQDVVDSALAMVTRDALKLIDADVEKAIAALLPLIERHASDPVLERTLMQPTSVTSFGLKCEQWAAPLVRSRQRLQARAASTLSLQLGSGVGSLAQMNGKESQLIALMANELQLHAPVCAWQVRQDEWAGLGCELGLLVGSLGKIAGDLALMGQYEVAELTQGPELARAGSSELSQRNPVNCKLAICAAQQTPTRVGAMLANLAQAGDGGDWQTELTDWQGLLTSASASAREIAATLSGLQVDTQRMRVNLETVRATPPANISADCLNLSLIPHAAQRARAQAQALGDSSQQQVAD